MFWPIQSLLPFGSEENFGNFILTWNEARREGLRLCSARYMCCGGSLRDLHPAPAQKREDAPSLVFTSLTQTALRLLQGIWRLVRELRIMLFTSLQLFINCLEDSCCSLLQQDLALLSVPGREGRFSPKPSCCCLFAISDGKIGVQQDCSPTCLGALPHPVVARQPRNSVLSWMHAGKRKEGTPLVLLPSYNAKAGSKKKPS